MTFETCGITQLTFLPRDIQRIIYSEYTELISQERFNEIIDNIPSQLSNDFPNENVFVDNLHSPLSLYEKLVQQLIDILKINGRIHDYMDLMQRDLKSAPGSTGKFITFLIIDFINVSVKQIKENDRINALTLVKNKLMKHIICENNLLHYNVHNGENYDYNDENEIIDTLHILDYRELLQLKCTCNSKVLFFDDDILKSHNALTYLKFNNCRRVIYNPVNKCIYYWINNHIGEPTCTGVE